MTFNKRDWEDAIGSCFMASDIEGNCNCNMLHCSANNIEYTHIYCSPIVICVLRIFGRFPFMGCWALLGLYKGHFNPTHTHTYTETYKSLTPCVPCVRVSVRIVSWGRLVYWQLFEHRLQSQPGKSRTISLWRWAPRLAQSYKHIFVLPFRKLW